MNTETTTFVRIAVHLLIATLALGGLAACGDADEEEGGGGGEVELGSLQVCVDGASMGGGDVRLEVTGEVTALDTPVGDCARSVTLDDGAGATVTVGLRVEDAAGADITPAFALTVGEQARLLYVYRLVFGSVEGLVVRDDAGGLVLAAEEGTWGGALAAGDVPEVSVERGSEVIGVRETGCEPQEGYGITFTADDAVSLTPVEGGALTVGGEPMTALAVVAFGWGEGTNCVTTDRTEQVAWAVHR